MSASAKCWPATSTDWSDHVRPNPSSQPPAAARLVAQRRRRAGADLGRPAARARPDPVPLTDGVTITSLRRAPGAMQIEMYQTRDPDAGLVRLIMTDDPIELRQWYIVDGSGKEVHVGLDKVEIGIPLSNNLFVTPTM